MKVTLPNLKLNKKQLAIYISIIIVCIISIIIAIYVQFYARIDITKLFGMQGKGEFGNKTEEQIETLSMQFEQIFTNSFKRQDEEIKFNPKENGKDIVYTKFEKKENKINSYEIEVNIPYINIDDDIIDKYNTEIEDFINKTNSILESEGRNTIYTVEYAANIEDDILSLIIRSNLKEGNSAQRVIIQTYNYDLRNNKEVTLKEILKIKDVDVSQIQDKIRTKIQSEQNKVKDLKELGYNIYSRDVTSKMYDIENTTEFYLIDDTLYIIYPYGNETFTSEMDLVIL